MYFIKMFYYVYLLSPFYFLPFLFSPCFFSTTIVEEDIPSDMVDLVKTKKHELIESVANVDETLGEMFLSDQTPTTEQLMVGQLIN